MSDWASYRLKDFIPFTAEVYLRLLERMGEAFWPLHLLTLGIGLAALLLALTGRARISCVLIAPLWAFVGIAFLLQRYAELNWAGAYFGWAFLAQSVLLLVLGIAGRDPDQARSSGKFATVLGALLVLAGLAVYPLIAVIAGQAWLQAETFGIHPDPTAVTMLGLGLISLRRARLWLAAIVPMTWLVVSALTLMALEFPWALVPLSILFVSLTGMAWKSVSSER